MNLSILTENQKRRLDFPMWMVLCFAMFNAWQMGIIFFTGSALVLHGRTPIPVSADSFMPLIVGGYIALILYILVLPRHIVHAVRVAVVMAFLFTLGLSFPFSPEIQAFLIRLQVFFCCFMIGFETAIIAHLFTEKTAIKYLLAGYSVALVIIAFLQNDIFPVEYRFFHWITLGMLALMILFFFRLPLHTAPIFVRKSDSIVFPKRMFGGILLLVCCSCLMAVFGPAAVGEVSHGVSIAYGVDAIGSIILFLLYLKKNVHPLHSVSFLIAVALIGYLALYATNYFSGLSYIACGLVGLGFIPCQLLPLYGVIMMKQYPVRYITVTIIALAMVAVVIHSSLIELFREAPSQLFFVYLAIVLVLGVSYLMLEPYLINIFRGKSIPFDENIQGDIVERSSLEPEKEISSEDPYDHLTKREREVLNLLACGYTNGDIAKMLFISNHTVNDYTKKIYRKLDVHSRHAAAQLVHRHDMINRSLHENIN